MFRHPIRSLFFFILIVGIGIFAYAERVGIQEWVREQLKPELPTAEDFSDQLESIKEIVENPAVLLDRETDAVELPSEKLLSVPFTSQAPHANWDMPYQEACEEASLLMVAGYYRGERGDYMPDAADRMILDLVDFEEGMGLPMDITVAEAKKVVEAYYSDLQATVIPIEDAEDIKLFLAKGIPVIVPADGKVLPNPNFQNGGPIYHMLVVIGYTDDGQFITNDPGTRLGKSFLYEEQALIDAIHDWNGGDVPNGEKVGLIVTVES